MFDCFTVELGVWLYPRLCIAEVKANAKDFGAAFDPEIRVDRRKMSTIIKTATLYLAYELKKSDGEWRVDIISVTLNKEKNTASIKHFKNVAEDYQ